MEKTMLRTIVFSWEYPPRVVGQLSDYVKTLSTALAKKKFEVNVVTYDEHAITETLEGGVKTYRVTNPVKTHIGVLTWVLTLNQEVERASSKHLLQCQQENRFNRCIRLALHPSSGYSQKRFRNPIHLLGGKLRRSPFPNC